MPDKCITHIPAQSQSPTCYLIDKKYIFHFMVIYCLATNIALIFYSENITLILYYVNITLLLRNLKKKKNCDSC